MIHDLKIWPRFFAAVANGQKRCEVRRNDRDYQEADTLNLREWDPLMQQYTGRGLTVAVTHVLRISELDAPLKNVMGLNPCTGAINELAILSIALLEESADETT